MTRFVFLSDTHSCGARMGTLPSGDVLVHAGDFTNNGGFWECSEALRWFGSHPHRFKLLIPGNHDMLSFNDNDTWNLLVNRERITDLNQWTSGGCSLNFSNGSSCFVQGRADSPASERAKSVSPRWGAFQYLRAAGYPWADFIQEAGLTDLLVTHGPPKGIGDLSYGVRFGCPDLRNAVNQRKPKLHVFGHNHEENGHWQIGDTLFCNVSTNHGQAPATVLDFIDGNWHFISGPTTN